MPHQIGEEERADPLGEEAAKGTTEGVAVAQTDIAGGEVGLLGAEAGVLGGEVEVLGGEAGVPGGEAGVLGGEAGVLGGEVEVPGGGGVVALPGAEAGPAVPALAQRHLHVLEPYQWPHLT